MQLVRNLNVDSEDFQYQIECEECGSILLATEWELKTCYCPACNSELCPQFELELDSKTIHILDIQSISDEGYYRSEYIAHMKNGKSYKIQDYEKDKVLSLLDQKK